MHEQFAYQSQFLSLLRLIKCEVICGNKDLQTFICTVKRKTTNSQFHWLVISNIKCSAIIASHTHGQAK